MQSILIIGASGYIGAGLSYFLATSGYHVTALCYPNAPIDDEWLSSMSNILIGDISSKVTIDEITNNKYDVAIHLVSLNDSDSNKMPNYVNSVNVMPVWNILELFKSKNNLKKFFYFSTIHVYGPLRLGKISESQNINPNTPYALTHYMAETICNYYNSSSNIDCINLRLSNSYGSPKLVNDNCWTLVVNELCRSAFFNQSIVIKSDGSACRDFIHHRDIYQAISKLINTDIVNTSNTYNLSSGFTLSIREIADRISNIYCERYGTYIDICTSDTGELITGGSSSENSFTIDNSKLCSMGVEPNISLKNGIEEIFEYFEFMNHG
jgi:UDP-glucose 4-epimerase